MHETVTTLLDEVKALWMVTESLSSFTDWPDDLTAGNSAPNHAPAAEKIMAWDMPETSPTSPICRAVQQAALHVNWQLFTPKQRLVGIFWIIMPILN